MAAHDRGGARWLPGAINSGTGIYGHSDEYASQLLLARVSDRIEGDLLLAHLARRAVRVKNRPCHHFVDQSWVIMTSWTNHGSS
eukprot:1292241-Pyramimonas_sp.AAC.1